MLSFDNTEVAFSHKSNSALRKSYRLFQLMNNNTIVKLGSKLATVALQLHLPIGGIVRKTVYEQFCGGETLADCQPVIHQLGRYGVKTLLDYGVEAKERDKDFKRTVKQQIKTIEYAATQPYIAAVSCKITGFARFGLLEKISQEQPLHPDEEMEWQKVVRRMHKLCTAAQNAKVSLYFDAEESWIQPALDGLIMAAMEKYNRENPIIVNTVQLYRHDRLAYLQEIHEEARQKGYILAVKLVRGAYMEKERQRAEEMNYPSPIQPDKYATDRDYNAALDYCIKHIDSIVFCNASHNEESSYYLTQAMAEHHLLPNHPHVSFGQLYGMSDNLSFNLANAGYNVSKYLPYGPVSDVMPYLMRRANENTSIAGQTSRELRLIQAELQRRGLQ